MKGFQCLGITSRYFPQVFYKMINDTYRSCNYFYNRSPQVGNEKLENTGTNTRWCQQYHFTKHFKNWYFDVKVKKFIGCKYNTAMHLIDGAILFGIPRVSRYYQASHGLVADGIFGSKSRVRCKGSFNKAAFLKLRRDWLQNKAVVSREDFPRWLKRNEKSLKIRRAGFSSQADFEEAGLQNL